MADTDLLCPHCQQRIAPAAIKELFACPNCGEALHGDDFAATVRLANRATNETLPLPEGESTALPGGNVALPGIELLEEVGKGGFGTVYRAVEESFGREVAVKVQRGGGGEADEGRFVSEAVITGNLQHPNIVPVHCLGKDANDHTFFTMKIAAGELLADILDGLADRAAQTEEAYPLPRLLQAFIDICDAVAYAHAQGVIHRDLKPGNVILGDFGQVYVLDWGLAKIVGSEEPPAPTPRRRRPSSVRPSSAHRIKTRLGRYSHLTLDGTVMGTPGYMPPEQAAGRLHEVDERSDVYSLGAILYEILTLHLPVKGSSPDTILRNTLAGNIRPARLAAKGRPVPPELAAIAEKALAFRPEDRYPGVQGLAQDVRNYLEDREVSVYPDPLTTRIIKWARRNRTTAASLVSIVIVSIAAILGVLGVLVHTAHQRASQAEARARAEEQARRESSKRLEAEKKARGLVEREKQHFANRAKAYAHYIDGMDLARRPGLRRKGLAELDEALRISQDFLEARFLRAGVRRDLRLYDEALRDCEEVNRLSERMTGRGHAHALLMAGDIWRNRTDGQASIERALAFYDKAAAVDPDNPHGQIARVVAMYLRGSYKQALRAAHELAAKHPTLWEVHYVVGFLCMGRGRQGRTQLIKPDYEGSIEAYSKAIRLQPTKANLYQNRGAGRFMLFQQTKEASLLKGAVSDFELAAAIEPDQPAMWRSLLRVHYYFLKDYEAALRDILELERLPPQMHNLQATKAFVYEAMGRYADALEAIKKALEVAPEEKTFLKFKADMEKKVAEGK